MGIKNFFKNIGENVRKAGNKFFGGIKKSAGYVGRLSKPMISIAKPILNGMATLPGNIGIIGKVGSAVAGAAKNIIDQIPNQSAKDKLNSIVDKGMNLVNTGQQKAQSIANQIQPYAKQGLQIVDRLPQTMQTINNSLRNITHT